MLQATLVLLGPELAVDAAARALEEGERMLCQVQRQSREMTQLGIAGLQAPRGGSACSQEVAERLVPRNLLEQNWPTQGTDTGLVSFPISVLITLTDICGGFQVFW